MLFVRCRTRRREGFPAIKRIGRIRRPGRAPPASVPNRRASGGGDSTSPRACPCRSTNRRHPPARTLHACPANSARNRRASTRRRRVLAPCRSTNRRHPPARTLHACPRTPPATVGRQRVVAACLPLPLNESTVSAGPDAPRLPANSTRNRRTSTRHRGELPPAIRCIESAARSPTRPVACQSDPQNRSPPRRHGVERRPPASRVPPTAPLARRASRAARAPARRARSGKPPPRNRAHRVDQRARDG
ncbi:hypothetical protein DO73_5911 [Burkholderia pseudomallei]|nr:hypothetical protein DO73_5911 [Burkholderia pseudomallei]